MTDLDLDALEAAVAAMTPRPWHWDSDEMGTPPYELWRGEELLPGLSWGELVDIGTVVGEADADGLVALRNAAPALIALARRAEQLEAHILDPEG